MAIDTPAKIALLGAGPIGLEVALYARYLGYDVEIFEAGSEPAAQVRQWEHVLTSSPFRDLCSPLAIAALRAQNEQHRFPAFAASITGREWREAYLLPLANSDLLIDFLHVNARVVSVGKVEISKDDQPSGEYDRGAWDFRLLIEHADGSQSQRLADVVVDCSGVHGQPLPLGQGGVPSIGEREARDHIAYGFPDVAGHLRSHYAGLSILVVGDAKEVVPNLIELLKLRADEPSTSITWITRCDPIAPGVARVAKIQEALAHGEIVWHGEAWVEQARCLSDGRVAIEIGGQRDWTWEGHQVISANGFWPDWALSRELNLDVCPVTDAPRSPPEFATSNLRFATHEPNYYVLGRKSSGRAGEYTHVTGLQQVQGLFALLADRADLDLYAKYQCELEH